MIIITFILLFGGAFVLTMLYPLGFWYQLTGVIMIVSAGIYELIRHDRFMKQQVKEYTL